MKRFCGMCLAQGKRAEARYVASDADGLMWFECEDGHGDRDNLAGTLRIKRVPLVEFLAQIGVTLDQLDDIDEPAPPTERSTEYHG
jgi:hypothetical protein